MTTPAPGRSPAAALSERLYSASIEFLDVLNVCLGDRLGLYRTLAKGGPATPSELATWAGIHPRYAREWLEQQAVSGIVDVEDPSAGDDDRCYSLPADRAEALLDPESPLSIVPLLRAAVACAQALPRIADAFRTGGGLAWGDFGRELVEAQGDFNRAWLMRRLGREYLPSIPDVHARLSSYPQARVADFACGVGWASIAVARAYRKVLVDGFDLDETSIGLARRNAVEHEVADRVTFEVRDAADSSFAGAYDLALVIEAIHDLARPVEALATIRGLLRPGGTVIVAEEKTAACFAVPADAHHRLLHGFSVVCCLPAGMSEQPSAGTGAVIRESTFRRYAEAAGFREAQVLPLDHPTLRFYQLFS